MKAIKICYYVIIAVVLFTSIIFLSGFGGNYLVFSGIVAPEKTFMAITFSPVIGTLIGAIGAVLSIPMFIENKNSTPNA